MRRILSAGCCFCFLSFALVATALPKKESNAVNEDKFSKTSQSSFPDLSKVCVRNEVVYSRGENFNTGNPCETCVCVPPEFECVMKTCEPIKPGCTNIYVADRCCPQSICECEFKGRIYSNGEKVKMPDPCHICYCQGGDIKCASIVCYSRDDCKPIYAERMCCPKYENCPLEAMKNKSASPKPTPVVISDFQSFESDDSLKVEERKKQDAGSVPTLEIEEITVPYSKTSEVEGFGLPKPDQNPEVRATVRAGSTSSQQTPADEEQWATENSAPTEILSKSSENLRLQVPTDKPPDSTTSDRSSVNPYEVRVVAEVKFPFRAASEKNSAPGLKMLSAEQIQFLKVGEESPVYADAPPAAAPGIRAPRSPRSQHEADDRGTVKVLETNNSATVNP